MTELYTTFALARAAGACPDGYRKLAKHLGGVAGYGKDTPIPLTVVLDSNGLADTLWTLRCVGVEQDAQVDRIARLFAADCAEHVLHVWTAVYPGDNRPAEAIRAARAYAIGETTKDELRAAEDAAWAAADEASVWAAASAARAAAAAASAAAAVACAARAAASAPPWAERDWQTERLREMLKGG